MSIREQNGLKSRRLCLKCGKAMWTDRCHRICPKCAHDNERFLESRIDLAQDLRQLVRQLATSGIAWSEMAAVPAAYGED